MYLLKTAYWKQVRAPALGAVTLICLAPFLLGANSGWPAPDSLVDAAKRGDTETVEVLIRQGADVNIAHGDGMTALHWAGERGDAALAQLLLSAGAELEKGTRIGGYTALHLASNRGHTEVARLLIEAGAIVTAATTHNHVTPLHLAAASGEESLVRTLLDHGAELDAREATAGQTPLMFAAANDRGAVVSELLVRGADHGAMTQVVDALAVRGANEYAATVFRETLEGFRQADGGGDDWAPTPAQVRSAVRSEREALLANPELKDHEAASPGRRTYRETLVGKTGGMTALLHASREGKIEAATSLLDGGADVNQVSGGDGTSPLLIATMNGHFDLALLLLERGADPTLAAETDGMTPLFAVVQLQWAPRTVYPQPRDQELQRTEYFDLMTALLEAGADPNARLATHLWYWEYGYTRIGIDIKGATPFWRAAFAQDVEAMRLLAEFGADAHLPTTLPEVEMRDPRQQDGRLAEDSGLPPVPQGAPNAYPIHAAAGGGYIGLGAWTVRGVPDGFAPAVKYLVEEQGADVNAVDWWGYRPLHYAASRGDNELILYLVDKGADVTALTRLGQSVADMTRGGRGGYFERVAHPETQALLESLGSPLECLNVHFVASGEFCPKAGATDFEELYGFPREPLIERFGLASDGQPE